jgi:hypothetical protein
MLRKVGSRITYFDELNSWATWVLMRENNDMFERLTPVPLSTTNASPRSITCAMQQPNEDHAYRRSWTAAQRKSIIK